jgi:DNA-binding transcriptional LysR family regulator
VLRSLELQLGCRLLDRTSRRVSLTPLGRQLPISEPDVTVGPVLSSEQCVVVVGRNHPLAGRADVTLDDVAGYRACAVASARRELAGAFLPPRAPDGRPLRRVTVRSTGETLTRVALGEAVYLTIAPFLDYVSHPAVVTVPVTGVPLSRTALVWLTAGRDPSVRAFARAASDIAGGFKP